MAACMRTRYAAGVTGRAISMSAVKRQNVPAEAAAAAAAAAADPEIAKKSFAEIQKERHKQAEHTVLISCPQHFNENKFWKYISKHGQIASHFFYESRGTHAVVEFLEKESIESLRAATRIPKLDNGCVIPFKSRLFAFKSEHSSDHTSVQCVRHSAIPAANLIPTLSAAEDINEQVHTLVEEYQLTDENIRLRFLVSSLVKDVASAHFPEATVEPYGSTVNSFGKLGCDLDLFMDFKNIHANVSRKTSGSFTPEYVMKHCPTGRVVTQRILSVIGECIDIFGAGCTGMMKILNARCPLVRFSHQPSGFQCDLTLDNRIALRSSELLYLYGNCDPRVKPLVFTLRCWARVHGVTSPTPGAWITNFSLTTMILFFLQKRNPSVIPTLDQLKGLAAKEDNCIVEGNDCTFVSDLNKITPSKNTDSVDTLLMEFFNFYGNFDFSKTSIDIRKGKVQNKPVDSPLYIQNPFEQSLNISKNVNQVQLDRFIAITQESAWVYQKGLRSQTVTQFWGLAALLHPSLSQHILKPKREKGKVYVNERLKVVLESIKADGNHQ